MKCLLVLGYVELLEGKRRVIQLIEGAGILHKANYWIKNDDDASPDIGLESFFVYLGCSSIGIAPDHGLMLSLADKFCHPRIALSMLRFLPPFLS